jgi:SAM-dependent methyltransferase
MEHNYNIEAYDAIASEYKNYSSIRKNYLDAIDKIVIKNLQSDMRLLDIGTGDGSRLKKIQKKTGIKNVIAIEPSREMAEICRKMNDIMVIELLAEKLDEIDLGKFDAIIALWNVFGHIGSSDILIRVLKHLMTKLNPNGIIMFDVNNRHNAAEYGHFRVFLRTIIDAINFDEKRGNATFKWMAGDKVIQGKGHLFTPYEIESIINKANLQIDQRHYFDYVTGQSNISKYWGQLFYILKLHK